MFPPKHFGLRHRPRLTVFERKLNRSIFGTGADPNHKTRPRTPEGQLQGPCPFIQGPHPENTAGATHDPDVRPNPHHGPYSLLTKVMSRCTLLIDSTAGERQQVVCPRYCVYDLYDVTISAWRSHLTISADSAAQGLAEGVWKKPPNPIRFRV